VTGVLDIDSDRPDNFDETDIRHLEEMVGLLFS
jgi:putative methionine-R-sulfoxide reductase with GAF domain